MDELSSNDFESALARARQCHQKRDWAAAHRAFLSAEQQGALPAEDIERLAQVAYLLGREEECLRHLERAHQAFLAEGLTLRAARSAYWLGITLMFDGQVGPAMGWFSRANRLVQSEAGDCVERGYLLLPMAEKQIRAGNPEAALEHLVEALELGERFDDADLAAAARQMQGRAKLLQGNVDEGLALLDEAMISVMAGELSPRVTGLIYCSVIEGCQQVYATERAREWTEALSRWCDEQPTLLQFTGRCTLHRAEVLQTLGQWPEAATEAEKAQERYTRAGDRRAQGAALYRQGEVHRVRGDLGKAEAAFERAGELGYDPQPGLALLRLVQGRKEQAVGAIDRVLSGIESPLQRTEVLSAAVEIYATAGDLEAATRCCEELEESAERFGIEVPRAMAAHARGCIQLAAGETREALSSLSKAFEAWQKAKAPYAEARTRCLMGLVCRALGDADGARLQFGAARAEFERLGARLELQHVQDLLAGARGEASPLSPRELEVLRLVATGKTTKAIAAELGLSVKTVDRHLSNLFNKLNVSSRAEATAYAYRHGLV